MWGPCRLLSSHSHSPTLTWGFGGIIRASVPSSFQGGGITRTLARSLLEGSSLRLSGKLRQARKNQLLGGAAGSPCREGTAQRALHRAPQEHFSLPKNCGQLASKSMPGSHGHWAAVQTAKLWRGGGQNSLGDLSAVGRNQCSFRHHRLLFVVDPKP